MIVNVQDRDVIAAWFGRDRELHAYELGDLDPFFWPRTRWYGWREHGALRAMCLVYEAPEMPAVLALSRDRDPHLVALVGTLAARLPDRIYSHLHPSVLDAFAAGWRVERRAAMHKMSLRRAVDVDTRGTEPLGPAHVAELRALFAAAYPDAWFDPRMLETGCTFGVRRDGVLVAAAGVHVFAPDSRVAAVGNVTTHPDHRRQGLASRVTARVCQHVGPRVTTIGLNVDAANDAAIRCYERLGFDVIGDYTEAELTRAR